MEERTRVIGSHLKRWRLILGERRSRVAASAGISDKTLERMEAGESGSLDAFLAVADVLGFADQIVDAADPALTDIGRARAHLWSRQRAPRTQGGVPW